MVRELGNPLGNPLGLPRNTGAVTEISTTIAKKKYVFSPVAISYTNTAMTSYGSAMYFDDDHIYFISNSTSANVHKVIFNRAAGTLGSITITSQSINSPFVEHYTIRVNNTFIACPRTAKKVTRSGDTLTLGWVVPLSGNHTIGGTAYSLNTTGALIRKMPDNTGYVVIFFNDNSATGYSHIFICDNSFNIIRSKQVYINTYSTGDAYITDNGFIIFMKNNQDNSQVIIINSSDLSNGSTYSINHDVQTYSSSTISIDATYYDRNTNRIHIIGREAGSGGASSSIFSCYYGSVVESTKSLIHYDGTVSTNFYAKFYDDGGCTHYCYSRYLLGFDAYMNGKQYNNEYGNPYLFVFGKDPISSYTKALPYAENSFTNYSGVEFDELQTFADSSNYVAKLTWKVTNNPYKIAWTTGEPSDGFAINLTTILIPIDDNYYMVFQQRVNTAGYIVCKIFKKSEVIS